MTFNSSLKLKTNSKNVIYDFKCLVCVHLLWVALKIAVSVNFSFSLFVIFELVCHLVY